MKKRKLKSYVLPTVYIMVIGVLFISIAFLGSTLQDSIEYSDMSVSTINDTESIPVVKEETPVEDPTITTTIVKPYTSEKVSISKSFYDYEDDETTQQKSLIYYENTYMPNSGVLYTSSEVFDVVSTYDGTVTKVDTDEILGNYIEITHNTNLKTIYYSLGDVNVAVDDVVKTGDKIGTSGDNLIDNETENCLLIEVYYNGFLIDPEEFYTMNIEDLS